MSAWAAITELLGADAAAKLVQRHGGHRIWIPRVMCDEHPLAELLGDNAAAKLIRRCGGSRISVPRGSFSRDFRDTAIRGSYRSGQTVATLARQWDLSERQVWRIVAPIDREQS